MKVITDPTRCMAAGYCQQVAPSLFELDEDTGLVRVLVDQVASDDEDDAREAETLCPNIAIRVIEEDEE
jgi:ferredoxin